MRYLYYPGCSLEGTAKEYNQSTLALMQALGHELQEVKDWTCCGASAAEHISALLALALPARNLALAESMTGRDEPNELLVPCSACYLNLQKAAYKMQTDPHLRAMIDAVLEHEQLTCTGSIKTRHLLDVLALDEGAAGLAAKVVHPLSGLRVAPYYGCQCLRPYALFDDPEAPTSMEGLIRAAGADVHAWSMGTKCCGASHMNTKPEVGLELTGAILEAAHGADVIATVCPMCQMNLEAFQNKISRRKGKDVHVAVVYLPQLLGLAVGLTRKQVQLDLNLSPLSRLQVKLASWAC